jgi:hypothetical protein
MPVGTHYKGLAAAVVLMGVAGVVVAQTSHSKPAAKGIDVRRTETLAWSLQLDRESTDALHGVSCAHVTADRYECVGNDASGKPRTLHIRVFPPAPPGRRSTTRIAVRWRSQRQEVQQPSRSSWRSGVATRHPRGVASRDVEAPDPVFDFGVPENGRLAATRPAIEMPFTVPTRRFDRQVRQRRGVDDTGSRVGGRPPAGGDERRPRSTTR